MRSLRLCFIILVSIALAKGEIKNIGWWKNQVFYQVYPRSFMDTDADGAGDLKGITDKLEHFVDAGISAIWLSPIYASPMIDLGYDISDFRSVDPSYGTMEDFEALIQKANKLGIRVVMDFVPNHTSDKHEWYIKSINGVDKYKDYYVWTTGLENNTKPPNNWISVFGGPMWSFNQTRGEWYLHQFDYRQIDLNFTNPDVHQEMVDILHFWLEKGIDGFRIDAIIHIYEKEGFPDEPLSHLPGAKDQQYTYLKHIYTQNDPRMYQLIQDWRKAVDDWTDAHNEEEKVMMTEAYTNISTNTKFYDFGSDIPFNFYLITEVNQTSKPSEFKKVVDDWISFMPEGECANWVMGNHDRPRIATRYPGRADQMTMLAMILPGIAVTYYGEEIGMEDDVKITWKQTKDPQACRLDPSTYQEITRDPARTPFQWDNTQNAGFSTAPETWLPLNENYKVLNLAQQKIDPESSFKVYQTLTKLRTTSPTLKTGILKVDALNKDTVLAVVRDGSNEAIVLLINFSDDTAQTVDVSNYFPGAVNGTALVASVGSGIKWGSPVLITGVELPPKVSLVISGNKDSSDSSS